jgi:hypothetical protein
MDPVCMKRFAALLVIAATVSCAQPATGPLAKAAKPPPARISSQSAAQPGQCMGLIGGERDQCLQRFGSSGAGASAPGGAPPTSK